MLVQRHPGEDLLPEPLALPTHEDAATGRRRSPSLDDDICIHIFTVSATMVGVCLTVIGIIRVILTLRQEDLLIDDLVASNMLLYMLSAFCSYWSLRTHRTRRGLQVIRVADMVFLVALGFTALNACIITWAMSSTPVP
ncbi:hypothetical protein HNP46_003752 [Pseudomonas nitritireducens]|uniref:Uncharacterized protein n=1 Tax=Pseudomonas nitroreducens TaxID=46680 RepID=A0A7W7P1U0_PSENT|nr:hypothetical protein [Pseudomonas nitritireducens]MBB4864876.1 hypothetical protein [Pseudomonas nitritireducens]